MMIIIKCQGQVGLMKGDDPKGRPSKGHDNECTKDTSLLLWP